MGLLIDGQWQIDGSLGDSANGAFQRVPSTVRHWLTPDGEAGPDGQRGFPAEPNRYHLYVAWNCPWAHRALLVRSVKRLMSLIDISIVTPARTEQGWVFDGEAGYRDNLFGYRSLHELYTHSDPQFTGRATVPVLWDKQGEQIVSNESADIVRMLNTAFDRWVPETLDLYPAVHRQDIDAWNELIYPTLNNGVYRAGFATSQAAYDAAVTDVFRTLDRLETHLSDHAFLAGEAPTEADWRLFPTLVRFDVAYYSAFKCNLRRIADYPELWHYTKRLYDYPGVAETVKFDIYRRGYHSRSEQRNPHGIVPVGPAEILPAG